MAVQGTGQVFAVKIVAVDTDLQEIIKEISIMQQCNSDHVVKYFGSYFKLSDLWVSGEDKGNESLCVCVCRQSGETDGCV